MVIKSDKAYKSLTKKGFLDAPGDHTFLEFYHDDKLFVRTNISHGATHDLNDFLIGKMANQCKLDKKDFTDLINCPLSAAEYLQKLINKGIVK